MNQSFNEWLTRHPCSTEELWKLQNMLGSIGSAWHGEAVDAWDKSRSRFTSRKLSSD